VKDAQQLISKVLQTKAYVKKDAKGPIVGMTGGSYGGGIQANVAENDPRIRAINPGRTWNDLRYSLDPNNYVVPGDPTGFSHDLNLQGVFKQEWTSLFFASGNGNPVGGVPPTGTPAGTCPQDKLASGDPTTVAGAPCLGFLAAVCTTYADLSASGDSTADDRTLVADASGDTQIAKLTVPTLLFQGQADTLFNTNDAVSTYLNLKRRGVPVQMVWNSGGHGGYDSLPGECDVYGRGTTGLDSCYLTLRTLQFFDHWLKGKPDSSPGFSWYRDWTAYSGSGPTTQYGDAPAFPLTKALTWSLSGTTDLTVGSGPAGTSTILNPVGGLPAAYTETSNFTGPASSPQIPLPVTEIPGQHVDFTSAPFPAAVDAVGVPSARLKLSHVAPTDLVLFGKVYDVAPDGTATLIHRLIAPARIPTAALGAPVDIKLAGFAHRFGAGHRVRLTLATTDTTSYNNKVADVITVTSGPGTQFVLPVVPAAVAAKPPVRVPTAPKPTVGGPSLPSTGLPWALPTLALVLLTLGLRRRVSGATPNR
jgi:ABC-2 type transport system ATP-binding protein